MTSDDSNQRATPKLTLVKDAQSYFKDMIEDALKNQGITTQVHTEFYLVNLLSQFMHSDKLFSQDEETGIYKQEALAQILQASLEAVDYLNRQKTLKKLGDVSLYTAGFFSESLNRKSVDVDYYIDMGKSAYSKLSNIIPDEDFSKLFAELSTRFDKFVDVLNEIREKTSSAHNPQSVLRLYELWLKTNSEHAEKKLKDAGIVPVKDLKKLKKQ